MSASEKSPAAAHTLMILKLLAEFGPMPARLISYRLELPRSSVYQLLDILIEHGFVIHLKEEKRYGLGAAAFEIGGAFVQQKPLARLGRALLIELADSLGESVHLAVMRTRDVLYIATERAKNRPRLVAEVGVRLPANLTATGLAMLAAMPREQLWALFPKDISLPTRTGEGATTFAELRSRLVEVRRHGYAYEDGAISSGFRSVAVAVLNHVRWPVAAIAVTHSVDNSAALEPGEYAARVAEAANELSRRIYGKAT